MSGTIKTDDDCLTEKSLIAVTAIVGLVALEVTALATGHDGALLLPVAALIGGIAGYKIPSLTKGKTL